MTKYMDVFEKAPTETESYVIDYTKFLQKISPTATLASATVTITCLNGTSSTLTNVVNSVVSPYVLIWLSSGTHGYDYKVTVHTTLTGTPAFIDKRQFKIKVRE